MTGGDAQGTEGGSATIWVLVAVAILCALAGVSVAIGAIAITADRARTAADASVLARNRSRAPTARRSPAAGATGATCASG